MQAGPTAVVSLRGLTIDMRGTDNPGISFVSGNTLHVRDCLIRGASIGIEFIPASGITKLYVVDSVISNSGDTGIHVQPTGSAEAKIMVDRVRMENAMFHGIVVTGHTTTGSITATVRDSIASGGLGTGISANDAGGGTTRMMVDRSVSLNNFHGVGVGGANSTIWIGDSTVSGNAGWIRIRRRRQRLLWDQQGQRQRHRRRGHHDGRTQVRRAWVSICAAVDQQPGN